MANRYTKVGSDWCVISDERQLEGAELVMTLKSGRSKKQVIGKNVGNYKGAFLYECATTEVNA